MRITHGGWPYGHQIDIAFENKHTPKDGPSAGVACALLLDSALSGEALDETFAITGDLNADGSVQPIGGVVAKVEAAQDSNCSRIAIPASNAHSLTDSIVMDGTSLAVSIPIFAIESFEEAKALAKSERSQELNLALEEFSLIQDVYKRNPNAFHQTLKHPAMLDKLNGILENSPNFYSAQILRRASAGSLPSTLSLSGSLDWIRQRTSELVQGIGVQASSGVSSYQDNGLIEATYTIERNRNRLDPRCTPYSDAIVDFGRLIRKLIESPPGDGTRSQQASLAIRQSIERIDAEYEKILKDPEFASELLE